MNYGKALTFGLLYGGYVLTRVGAFGSSHHTSQNDKTHLKENPFFTCLKKNGSYRCVYVRPIVLRINDDNGKTIRIERSIFAKHN